MTPSGAEADSYSNSNGAHREDYTWANDPTTGNPYISTVVATEDYLLSSQVQKKTTQTIDQYGNVTQAQVFGYGAPGQPPQGTAARTTANHYIVEQLYNGNYQLYI